MKFKKKIALGLMMVGTMFALTGCVKPYNKPVFVTIEASQTAFLIPLTGDTKDQASFASEELLEAAKVATKEIQIPRRWVQTGRMSWDGEYRDAAKLIVVERTPETREWNSGKGEGTSAINQAIYAESKESIGFSVGMNCSAQIDTESDAVRFLYSYNNKSLKDVMDTEIRARVESDFVEQCAKYSLNDVLANKEPIMSAVRNEVMSYFKEKGITITVLGMKDGIAYDDSAIQEAINAKFSSEQKLVTQQNDNAVVVSKAEADAKAKVIAAEAEATANQKIAASLTSTLVDKIKYEKWNGELPQVSGSGATIVDIGATPAQ